jgi:hypothetical protein
MLSMTDLLDFAEISRALDRHNPSEARTGESMVIRGRIYAGINGADNLSLHLGGTRLRHYCKAPGGFDWVNVLSGTDRARKP